MGKGPYFTVNISVSKGTERPWLQRFTTYGGYKVLQFGVLGMYVQLNYGIKNA